MFRGDNQHESIWHKNVTNRKLIYHLTTWVVKKCIMFFFNKMTGYEFVKLVWY